MQHTKSAPHQGGFTSLSRLVWARFRGRSSCTSIARQSTVGVRYADAHLRNDSAANVGRTP